MRATESYTGFAPVPQASACGEGALERLDPPHKTGVRVMKPLNIFKVLLGACAMSLLMAGAAQAADQGSAADAEAMVKRAVAYIKANGPEKAYEEFTNGKSFKDRGLYVIVNDMNGKSLAHGGNPKLVGKELGTLKDADGKPIFPLFLEAIKGKDRGWTADYKFLNPATQKIETKASFFERVGDTNVGVGMYK
jgi:hypothetical protein